MGSGFQPLSPGPDRRRARVQKVARAADRVVRVRDLANRRAGLEVVHVVPFAQAATNATAPANSATQATAGAAWTSATPTAAGATARAVVVATFTVATFTARIAAARAGAVAAETAGDGLTWGGVARKRHGAWGRNRLVHACRGVGATGLDGRASGARHDERSRQRGVEAFHLVSPLAAPRWATRSGSGRTIDRRVLGRS